MNDLAEKDWELINAYHDGELSRTEALALEARLPREPSLTQALQDVRVVSSSLAGLRPGLAKRAPAAANVSRGPGKWWTGGAIAAALSLAIFFAVDIFSSPTPLEIHAAFTDQAIHVDESDPRPATLEKLQEFPDLAPANLVPVTAKVFDEGIAVHYAGPNGCRLSYIRGTFRAGTGNRAPAQHMASWTTTGDVRHTVVATDMDRGRFDAIASYLEHVTHQDETESVLASLESATREAAACIG